MWPGHTRQTRSYCCYTWMAPEYLNVSWNEQGLPPHAIDSVFEYLAISVFPRSHGLIKRTRAKVLSHFIGALQPLLLHRMRRKSPTDVNECTQRPLFRRVSRQHGLPIQTYLPILYWKPCGGVENRDYPGSRQKILHSAFLHLFVTYCSSDAATRVRVPASTVTDVAQR